MGTKSDLSQPRPFALMVRSTKSSIRLAGLFRAGRLGWWLLECRRDIVDLGAGESRGVVCLCRYEESPSDEVHPQLALDLYVRAEADKWILEEPSHRPLNWMIELCMSD